MKTSKAILILVSLFIFSTLSAGEIHEAVKNNDLNKVKILITKNPDLINSKDDNGRTPLHWACRGTNLEMITYLIQNNADVNAQDLNKIAPLHSTASHGNVDATSLLLKHKAQIDIIDLSGNTPLHYAAMDGQSEIVTLLVKNGASLEIGNVRQRTPLTVGAREKGGIDVIRILVENGANVNNVDIYGDTPLMLAAWRGYRDIINYLIEKQTEIPIQGSNGIELMGYAVNKKLWKLYKKILSNGGDVFSLNSNGISLLHLAAKGGSVEITKDLINKRMPVNAKDIYGYLPIHYAAKYGRLPIIKILLDNKANMNCKTLIGETPYNLAKREEKKEVVEFLKSKGANQDVVTATKIKGQYFGQKIPGKTPRLFAPGIVSNFVGGHSNVVFSPDGKEAIWTEWNETETGYSDGCMVWFTKVKNGFWTLPEKLLKFGDTPVYSSDGNKIFFMASIPQGEGQRRKKQIMYFDREDDTLSTPKLIDFNLAETGLYWQFTLDENQNIYFGGRNGLCRSILKDGKYQALEKLSKIFHPDYKGGSPYISPDGSYIIFSSRLLQNSIGQIDLYIGFKKSDGTWTEPINMGPNINTQDIDMLPIVTLDGKYLFLRTKRDGISGIYWVSTKIIEELKPKELK